MDSGDVFGRDEQHFQGYAKRGGGWVTLGEVVQDAG